MYKKDTVNFCFPPCLYMHLNQSWVLHWITATMSNNKSNPKTSAAILLISYFTVSDILSRKQLWTLRDTSTLVWFLMSSTCREINIIHFHCFISTNAHSLISLIEPVLCIFIDTIKNSDILVWYSGGITHTHTQTLSQLT